jgi:flavin-dependent dehydrogenase
MPSSGASEYDAVIVGASIAGCTAATFLARDGAKVALLERSPNAEAYKVICTHAILACGTGTLQRLGMAERIEAAGGLRNEAWTWNRRGWVRPQARPGQRLSYGYNIRRERLDPMIRALAAETEGVTFLPGASVTGLVREPGGRAHGVLAQLGDEEREFHGRVVIGADGRDSKVAQLAGLPEKVEPNARFIYFAHYRGLELERPLMLWNLEPEGAAAFANDDGITLMACAPHVDRLPEFRADLEGSYTRFFDTVPDSPNLGDGERVTKIMGRIDMSNIRRRASGPGVALIGDAAQASDPLWGVGCGWALQSGEWLAQELAGSLSSPGEVDAALKRYRKRHRHNLAPHHRLIADYSTGRPLNRLEKMLFLAAPRDQRVAFAFHRFANRLDRPERILTPPILVRAARTALAARRHPDATG